MKIAITGGTGLIGNKLAQALYQSGHDLIILTRNAANKQNKERMNYVEWLTEGSSPLAELEGTDVFVNFAGESLMGRWTSNKKERIISSRLEATNELISIMKHMGKKPEALINGGGR